MFWTGSELNQPLAGALEENKRGLTIPPASLCFLLGNVVGILECFRGAQSACYCLGEWHGISRQLHFRS